LHAECCRQGLGSIPEALRYAALCHAGRPAPDVYAGDEECDPQQGASPVGVGSRAGATNPPPVRPIPRILRYFSGVDWIRSVRTTGVIPGDAQRAFGAAGNTRVAPVTNGRHVEALVDTGSHVAGVGGDAARYVVLHAQLRNPGDGSLNFRIVARQAHVHGQVSRADEDRAHTGGGHDGFGIFHASQCLDLHHGQQLTAWVQRPGVGALYVVVHAPVPGSNAWGHATDADGVGDVRAAWLWIAHGGDRTGGLF